ncbi:bifunctional riboflavin kinase/FAD synthetase [Moheibacter sediminis]|uniref:Riboflavin biosynthesis protein n=1 Tax=Moheibacter sediminis TaxID=1434700 RepID=A0A1W1YHX2_9FLAO|nr:bifunctional riboflavin kinase/FAD synthetase [Moheibacter sediminis]SMC35338.1 riboflavin kinase / FMN adenylyltransferase [Moheibacter sediminis]
MKIFKDISACKNVKNPVLTLGMFDGVHIGHQCIIQKLIQIAEEIDGESTLLTFEPHPRLVLSDGKADLDLLNTLEEKIELLEQNGLQNLILHPFTKEFSQLSSEEFVRELLVNQIGVHTIVIGYDHHFGRNREGNFEQLQKLSQELNFNLIKLEEVKSDDLHISSTQIRNGLLEGNVEFAQKGLGRFYSLKGKVVHGDKLGRTLGFPTANLELPDYKLIPKNGVYLVKVNFRNEIYKGLLSIGTRPTVTNSNEKRIEVFILDFKEEIYGETLDLKLIRFIRDDMKFNSLEELISQMNYDKLIAKNFIY